MKMNPPSRVMGSLFLLDRVSNGRIAVMFGIPSTSSCWRVPSCSGAGDNAAQNDVAAPFWCSWAPHSALRNICDVMDPESQI